MRGTIGSGILSLQRMEDYVYEKGKYFVNSFYRYFVRDFTKTNFVSGETEKSMPQKVKRKEETL